MKKEMIIVLDFGGQYNQLIARRVRECNVYCEVHPYTMSLDKIKEMIGEDETEQIKKDIAIQKAADLIASKAVEVAPAKEEKDAE